MQLIVKNKLDEICFFLGLIERLERDPNFQFFPNSESSTREAEFLFSAVLNAMYSTLEVFKNNLNNLCREERKSIKTEVDDFKARHGLIYNRSPGLRNFSVHRGHLEACDIKFFGADPDGDLALNKKFFLKLPEDETKHIHGLKMLQEHFQKNLVPFLNEHSSVIAMHST